MILVSFQTRKNENGSRESVLCFASIPHLRLTINTWLFSMRTKNKKEKRSSSGLCPALPYLSLCSFYSRLCRSLHESQFTARHWMMQDYTVPIFNFFIVTVVQSHRENENLYLPRDKAAKNLDYAILLPFLERRNYTRPVHWQ